MSIQFVSLVFSCFIIFVQFWNCLEYFGFGFFRSLVLEFLCICFFFFVYLIIGIFEIIVIFEKLFLEIYGYVIFLQRGFLVVFFRYLVVLVIWGQFNLVLVLQLGCSFYGGCFFFGLFIFLGCIFLGFILSGGWFSRILGGQVWFFILIFQ